MEVSYSRPNIERLIWLDERGMIHPSDILDAIKSDMAAWKNYEKLSEPYKRIRIAYIDAARNRPVEFKGEKRAQNRNLVYICCKSP